MAEQFEYNSDFPSHPNASEPLEFPPAVMTPCARITTRIYNPHDNQITTVQNVLVRTLPPPQRIQSNKTSSSKRNAMDDNDDDDDDDDEWSDDDESDDDMMMEDTGNNNDTTNDALEERAYWMQRTLREAIYGRVRFAVVLKKKRKDTAEWELTDERCAVKEMSWQHIRRERDRLAEDPIKEVSAMQHLKIWSERRRLQSIPLEADTDSQETSDPFDSILETNIMMPLDVLSDDRYLYSIMPFCDGGELFDRLDMSERFTEAEARYWMYQILNGVENLQHAGICHRDMSLENLLVHKDNCLIIDMGMCLRIPYADSANSQENGQKESNNTNNGSSRNMNLVSGKFRPRQLMSPQGTCGKWHYMSPEILRNRDAFDGFAVDMWATGVILFLMLTGFPPWERACKTDERFKYMTAGYLVQMLTEWDLGLSPNVMDLLQRMLWLDPKDRLSLEQVRAHPWMTNGAVQPPTRGGLEDDPFFQQGFED